MQLLLHIKNIHLLLFKPILWSLLHVKPILSEKKLLSLINSHRPSWYLIITEPICSLIIWNILTPVMVFISLFDYLPPLLSMSSNDTNLITSVTWPFHLFAGFFVIAVVILKIFLSYHPNKVYFFGVLFDWHIFTSTILM